MRKRPEPTRFLPGSPEKIEVMRKRIEDGKDLFHPLDATATKDGQHVKPVLRRGKVIRFDVTDEKAPEDVG